MTNIHAEGDGGLRTARTVDAVADDYYDFRKEESICSNGNVSQDEYTPKQIRQSYLILGIAACFVVVCVLLAIMPIYGQ